jgi:transcriptional regulator with AAA-type ATPase domain
MTTSGVAVFQDVLEAVDGLPVEQQEDILRIMQKRVVEKKRQELAFAVKEAKADYGRGKVRKGTVADLMKDLAE